MLHHENTPEGTAEIAELRVSPDELTRAIAALDAKKQEEEAQREKEERRLAETLGLGQAVDSLDLEYTPEELWAEVQTQRTFAVESLPEPTETPVTPVTAMPKVSAGKKISSTRTPMKWRPGRLAAGAVCLSALLAVTLLHAKSPNIGVSLPVLYSTTRHNPGGIMGFVRPVGILDEDFYRKLNDSRGPNPQYRIHIVSWESLKTDQTVYPLRAVPDGYSMFDDQDLDSGITASPNETGFVFDNNQDNAAIHRQEWMHTRYDGRYYIRGWIRKSDVPRLAQKQEVFVYANRSLSGTALQPITLAEGNYPDNCYSGPLTNATQSCHETRDSNEVLKIPAGGGVVLDKHAWEDFSTITPAEYQPELWAKQPDVFGGRNSFQSPGFDASSNVQPLSAVPSGTTIRCSDFTIDQMLHAYPYTGSAAKVPVDVRPDLYQPWRVVKLEGNTYIRGWIAAKITQQQASDRSIAMYSEPNTPEFINPPVQFSLRIDHVNWVGTSRNGFRFNFNQDGSVGGVVNDLGLGVSRLEVTNVHIDQHTWEKW